MKPIDATDSKPNQAVQGRTAPSDFAEPGQTPYQSSMVTWVQSVVSSWNERSASRRRASHVRIAKFSASTSYDCYVVSIDDDGVGGSKLFLKDFGHSKLIKQEPTFARADREIQTYQLLLSTVALGTARYVASIADDREGIRWLLLEFVDGRLIKHVPVEYWVEAVTWLGRLHGAFYSRVNTIEQPETLLRRDEAYYRILSAEAADSGLAVATLGDRPDVLRLTRAFSDIIPGIVALPITLIHGNFGSKQIVIDLERNPHRVSPVDWELAGIGSGVMDVAYFTDGFEGSILEAMYEAYTRAAIGSGLPVDWGSVASAVDWFRLERVMRWLAAARLKGYSPTAVKKVVQHGRSVLEAVGT